MNGPIAGRHSRVTLALVVMAGPLLAGCGDDGSEPSATAIVEVVVGGDDRTMSVRLGGDGTGGAVTAEESIDEVRLSGTSVEGCGDGGNCAGLLVPEQLDRTLGDRRLIDASTGEEIGAIVRCDDAPGPVFISRCDELAAG